MATNAFALPPCKYPNLGRGSEEALKKVSKKPAQVNGQKSSWIGLSFFLLLQHHNRHHLLHVLFRHGHYPTTTTINIIFSHRMKEEWGHTVQSISNYCDGVSRHDMGVTVTWSCECKDEFTICSVPTLFGGSPWGQTKETLHWPIRIR